MVDGVKITIVAGIVGVIFECGNKEWNFRLRSYLSCLPQELIVFPTDDKLCSPELSSLSICFTKNLSKCKVNSWDVKYIWNWQICFQTDLLSPVCCKTTKLTELVLLFTFLWIVFPERSSQLIEHGCFWGCGGGRNSNSLCSPLWLELMSLLSQPLECWDYRCEPPCPT
jgi:hypothetical protein